MRVPATPAGHDQPRDFVRSHGRIRMIGIEGTGSWGAGPARAPVGRRRADPRGHPSQALPAPPPASPGSDQSLSRRWQSTGRGRRPARGQDRHRPLRTDPGAPGPAPQRDEGPRPSPTGRSPPCRPPPPTPCAPAPHRLSGEGAHRRPGPHAPRPGHPPPPHRRPRERCAAWPAATGSRADEIADIDTELRAPTARAAPTMLATKALRRQPPPPRSPAPTDNPGRIRTEASFAALCGAAPIPAGPGRTNRHRLNRGGDRQANRAPHPNAPPARRPAHQGPRRPPHRHGQEPRRDTAPPPNAPSPAKHGTRRPTPNPHPAPTTCAEGATNEDSPSPKPPTT